MRTRTHHGAPRSSVWYPNIDSLQVPEALEVSRQEHRESVEKQPEAQLLDDVSPRGSPVASARTITRRLNEAGLFGRRSVKKPFISDRNRAARVAWAKEHLNWTWQQWDRVLWSDESKFMLFGTDGISYIRRPIESSFQSKNQTPTVKHDGGNVVWSCFGSHGVGPLYRINGIVDRFVYEEILEKAMLLFACASPRIRYLFQQDNDPKHTFRYIKKWFAKNHVDVMD